MYDRRIESQEHFRALVDLVEKRAGRAVSFDQWRSLARDYRIQSSQLAQLQTTGNDPDAVRYLNSLCLRAYTLLYAAPQRRKTRGRFFLADFPETLASTWRIQASVAALLLAAVLVGLGVASQGPGSAAALVPAAMYPPESLSRLASSSEARSAFLGGGDTSTFDKSIFSTYLFVHNTKIGLYSFATGILLGLPTLLMVIYNGLTLGAFASLFVATEQAPMFWAWIVPHAIPELLAIVLCSSGGLLMGLAIAAPGRPGRSRAIVVAARRALQLALGAIPLFVAAAGIESFVRESTLSTAGRFAVSVAAASAIITYVVGVRQLARRQHREVDVSFLEGRFTADPPRESTGNAPTSAR